MFPFLSGTLMSNNVSLMWHVESINAEYLIVTIEAQHFNKFNRKFVLFSFDRTINSKHSSELWIRILHSTNQVHQAHQADQRSTMVLVIRTTTKFHSSPMAQRVAAQTMYIRKQRNQHQRLPLQNERIGYVSTPFATKSLLTRFVLLQTATTAASVMWLN